MGEDVAQSAKQIIKDGYDATKDTVEAGYWATKEQVEQRG